MKDKSKETNVKATIDAVTGLAKAIPVYDDAIQPAAKELGKSLATVLKTVNIALAPIKALVWGYEKIEDYLTKRVSEKLSNIPSNNILTPPANIAGPAIESLRYIGPNENLRELYASLLAMSMNKNTVEKVHPSFVEIIKNLSSEEALMLKQFVYRNIFPKIDLQQKSENNEGYINKFINFTLFHETDSNLKFYNIPTYLDNLQRLGIIEILKDEYLTNDEEYEKLRVSASIADIIESIEDKGLEVIYRKGLIRLTAYGKDFVKNVVAID